MKHEFEIQRYHTKWLCALPLIIIALSIEFVISQHISSDIIFFLSCALVIGGLISIYSYVVDKLGYFKSKGFYWEDYNTIRLELNNKEYLIDNVKTIVGGEPNVFMYQYAYIMIKTPQYKIKIYGQTLHDNMKFKDSDLFPLYTLILQKNVSLKPKKVLDADVEGWYESK